MLFKKKILKTCLIFVLAIFCQKLSIASTSVKPVDLLRNASIYQTSFQTKITDIKAQISDKSKSKGLKNNVRNWLVFRIQNNHSDHKDFIIKTNLSDSLILYDLNTAKEIGRTGSDFPLYQFSRNILSGNIYFSLDRNETKNYALLVQGINIDKEPYIKITSADESLRADRYMESEAISSLSVLLAFFIFNYLVYLILKDKTYQYYLYYLFFLGLWVGILWMGRWSNFPLSSFEVKNYISYSLLILFNLAYLRFTLAYFQLPKQSKWFKLIYFFQFLYLIPVLFKIFNHNSNLGSLDDQMIAFLCLANILMVLICSVFQLKQNRKYALLFLIAEIPLIVGGIFLGVEFLFSNAEIQDRIGPTAFKIGILAEILLFSFALGNRYRDHRIAHANQVKINNELKEQKMIEFQKLISEKNVELENLVNARTAELEAANNKLIKSNQEKNKIFSILGHDLRSPIMSLQTMFDMFLTGSLSEAEFKSLAIHINDRLKGLNVSVQNLIVWAQSQMGQLKTNKVNVYLEEIILEKTGLMKFAADEKQINIEVEIDQDRSVFVDKDQIGILVQNILNNAIKFSKPNGTIKIVTSDDEAGYASIEIADNGVGMSQDLLFKINQNYIVESRNGTMGEQGTGLGLSICKEMILNNNGFININSEIGKGTRVFLKLPVSNVMDY